MGRTASSVVVCLKLNVGRPVKAKAGAVSFHARVCGASGELSELAPWALDATQQRGWEDCVASA